MTAKNAIYAALALGALAVLIFIAARSQHQLAAHLPVRVPCLSEADAAAKASGYVRAHPGGTIVGTSGTPSMEPYIHGVALVVLRATPFDQVQGGDLIAYHPLPGTSVQVDGRWVPAPASMVLLHVAAAKDAGGIIPSGLNNERYENWGRVTASNFVAKAEAVFTWPQ